MSNSNGITTLISEQLLGTSLELEFSKEDWKNVSMMVMLTYLEARPEIIRAVNQPVSFHTNAEIRTCWK